jgi:sugar O-acyltransferase (sialic acid O-acetyltransferase NeuD family)
MKRLAIIGSGDLGAQIAHHAKDSGLYEPIGYFDDYEKHGTVKNGLPIVGSTEDVLGVFKKGAFDKLMIGIGYKHLKVRASLFQKFKGQIPFASILHRSCFIDKSCIIGEGVFIYPGCKLDMNVVVKDNALLNIGCVIAHDTVIGENSFLGPAVNVAGFVKIDESVNLGIGTVVVDNIRIGTGVRTGGGAVVIETILEPGLYVGVPAKLKKA